MKNRKAYLFDIDGTLLRLKNKANQQIIFEMLRDYGASEKEVQSFDFAGKTDRNIFSRLLNHPSEEDFDIAKSRYLHALENRLSNEDIHVYDGVDEALAYVKSTDAPVGLLTGNFEKAARIKLEKSRLSHHFSFGAYGDHHHHRNDLAVLALKNLNAFSESPYSAKALVIIGDTPRDIECARHIGATALAVSTGYYSDAELEKFHPDVVLPSLSELKDWDEAN
ncbi:HAD family hydrolase [Balneolaceae bacterium ANBcel3]|nr:HAD family hydrolase [Balneolaceae bacterium ANBcel3]